MGRSTVHYADSETNNILKRLHNKLRPAGTPVERVEYIIELLLLRIFEAKIKQDKLFSPLRKLFEGENYRLLFSHFLSLTGEQVLSELNKNIFPFYASIISKARTVVYGNLPQKMQDQLVLMEEVFANSNFTNNVKGGVIAEVIGLVNEIDEKWILKTDLLGDAIESALSETGGTKDLGLYRTPEHIRKIMVEMVDPDFNDIIFDPACGTAGFLFDAFDYVVENKPLPNKFLSQQFYRSGIGGIEYQGRIRKMAAVNMYIRGLNPHNIAQGDSLKIYDPSSDACSKSVVIANPPFGAERDQPAYPNVWEEYSKESETTILFVKLMFDLLKQGGRCAVVVSEGFLTWGQNSACALRRLLLNEANLRAIISLPQGVFVSKSGQGAKTSTLYFEKGQPTDFIWYYKIENDGFSMGMNRKPVEGSQIPELLEIFNKIKHDKKPKETKNGFCIPKEWIETLDPRIAERIKKEVKERFTGKNKAKREKLLAGLDEKLAKGKLSIGMYDEKLWQFDNVVESQIDNEIAKAIEKANSYHFNLQNYRSNLSDEQIKDWQETLKDVEAQNGTRIEKRYQELKTADPKTTLQILASFDPKNALHMDIAKEYLSKLRNEVLEKNYKLRKLFEITKESRKYPFEPLKYFLIDLSEERKIELEEDKIYYEPTISTKTNTISINNEALGADLKVKKRIIIKAGDLVIGRMHTQNGSFAFADKEYISTGTFVPFRIDKMKINPKYLFISLKPAFNKLGIEDSTGRETYKTEEILQLQIPLPPLEVQNEIVEKIEKQKQIIDGASLLLNSWNIDEILFNNFTKVRLADVAEIIMGQSPNGETYNICGEGIPLVNGPVEFGDTPFSHTIRSKFTTEPTKYCEINDLIICVRGATTGRINISGFKACIGRGVAAIRSKYDQKFLNYCIYQLSKKILEQSSGKTTFPNLSAEQLANLTVPFPPLETQRQIVEKLDRQMQALEGVRLLKSEAQKRINEILTRVWKIEDLVGSPIGEPIQ